MSVSGETLYSVVTTGSIPEIVDVINNFKTFVKKEFVDIKQVPRYLEALCISVDDLDPTVSTSSFSVLAHLVKRVSMQDHTGRVLQGKSFLTLPVILKRLGDPKSTVRSTAKRALEAYWFLAPQDVEMALREIALGSQNALIVQELISWLHHIVINVTQLFKLEDFMSTIIRLVDHGDTQTDNATLNLFVDYYSLKQNQPRRHLLIKQLTNHRVLQKFIESVVNGIEKSSPIPGSAVVSSTRTNISQPHAPSKQHNRSSPVPAINTITKPSGVKSGLNLSTSSNWNSSSSSNPKIQPVPISPEVNNILSKLTGYAFDSSNTIKPVPVTSFQEIVIQLTTPFEGKETEFNWGNREKAIIQLRGIIRANGTTDLRSDFIHLLKENSESICKAISSLRTTLSTHGCQLVKESAMLLGADFDSVVDNFMPTLSKLTLATKNIASTNANIAICAIYANCSFQQKLNQKILQSSLEKNHQPRSYSGTWLQLFLVRFHSNSLFSAEVCTKVISKLLGDQNPVVRQIAKDTFWTFWKYFPDAGEGMMTRLDGNIVRALERSRPEESSVATKSSAPADSSSLGRSRSKPSLRESIISKNRELKEKQRSQALSRPSSNLDFHSQRASELKSQRSTSSLAYSRLSAPKRNFTHDSTPTTSSEIDTSAKARVSSATVGSVMSYKRHSFDLNADPILKFLSSNLQDEKQEGISLLKYAILGDEELSLEVNNLLTKVSISNPLLLKPLFLGSDELLFKSFKYFTSAEDYIRVCAILQTEVDLRYVNLIALFVPFENLYRQFTVILSYATKISSILNNGDLLMQMITYKSKIFLFAIQFLNLAVDLIPISDACFSGIIQELFEMVTILRSTDLFPTLIQVLKKFNSINNTLFTQGLHKTSLSIREEFNEASRIGMKLSKEKEHADRNITSYDMTKVILKGDFEQHGSPLKEPSDLTMIMPTFKKNEYVFEERKLKISPRNLDTEPKFDTVVEDNIDIDDVSEDIEDNNKEVEADVRVGHDIGFLNQDNDRMDLDDESNIFVEKRDSGRRSDLFAKFNNLEPSAELAEDFAQVKICEPNGTEPIVSVSSNGDTIQSFIEKMDPLNKISNKNKQIQIYHDESDNSGSPQKQREYNYNEMNWFNYLIAKARADPIDDNTNEGEKSVENLTSLCFKLSNCKILSGEFIDILNYLQDRKQTSILKTYLDAEGKSLIENSVIQFLTFQTTKLFQTTSLLSGLIILKQLLVNRFYLDLDRLWDTLLLLSEYCESLSDSEAAEVEIAINEVFDEMLVGSFKSQEILTLFTTSLTNIAKYNQSKTLFILESFLKFVNMNTIGFLLSDQNIHHIDNSLRNLLNDESVAIRRFVVLIYGKLLKANRSVDFNKLSNTEEKNVMENILHFLPVPQKKLIEFYSQ